MTSMMLDMMKRRMLRGMQLFNHHCASAIAASHHHHHHNLIHNQNLYKLKMEKAKQAVSSFLSNDGKHKTTVDEDVRPHVTEEHIRPHRHENITTALDKEVHQEHHHTTIQPITHKETLPEQHHHNLIPVEHKTFHHGNEQETRATLDREAAKFRDTTETHSTTHSSTTAPVVTGERIHHHVHEHVQPVIQKETIQPHVVHTTIPVHETHHAAPVHHGTSVLPTKTLDEFTSERGGLAEKAAQKLTEFEGCPKPYRKELQREQLDADKSMHLHGHGDNYGENVTHDREGAGLGQTSEGAGLHSGREGHGMGRTTEGILGGAAATRKSRHGLGHKDRRGSSSSSSSSSDEESHGLGKSRKNRGLGAATAGGAAGGLASHPKNTDTTTGNVEGRGLEGNRGIGSTTGVGAGTAGVGAGTDYDQAKTGVLSNDPLNKTHARPDSGVDMHTASSGSTTARKPSLIDRLNPLKDADGDGKKGFMG
ncbi:hypothetical protein NCS57_01477300 [Fusarium keratoplasticum]|uniref:Uncharacterized protein n=1 Tax=Fusarium keratoplasticum TaxID=1328300 RepID=A0ACC0QE09_9HYPO|nr:hypothetical protein NCS57_01477300 [Fusarium keratoplasticum]KAI8648655.1 hypothetical protein NCS57_01477300 [Fusarium keratoplasticum]